MPVNLAMRSSSFEPLSDPFHIDDFGLPDASMVLADLFGNAHPSSFNLSGSRPNAVADDFRDSLQDTTAPLGQLSPGGTINGSIETAGDRDIFAISLTAGQTYTFNLRSTTAGGDPLLRLLNSSGTQLAANDDFGGSRNSQITFTASQTGTYYLDAGAYASTIGNYTLSSTGRANPNPTPTDDYRDSLTDTTAAFGQLAVGGTGTGRIETGGDIDVFAITLAAGQSYTFNLSAASSGGLSDPTLRLLNSSGGQLAVNDDFGGSNNSQITYTATTAGTYYLEAKGYNNTLTGNYTLRAVQNTNPNPDPNPQPGGFDIVFNYTGDAQYRAAFEQAAARWEEIITGDIPDFRSSRYGLIDDLLIDASVVNIDGRGGVLGSAGPDELRPGSNLPAHGVMRFDSADIAALAANGTLVGVILHEMGHVLGLGTLWSQNGLTRNGDYVGQNALREYRTLSGDAGAAFIPIERDGGPGTAGGHWDEETFRSEIMTGFASGALEISRMTIGSLQDLGYTVNYAEADAYTLPGRQAGLQAQDSHAFEPIFGIL